MAFCSVLGILPVACTSTLAAVVMPKRPGAIAYLLLPLIKLFWSDVNYVGKQHMKTCLLPIGCLLTPPWPLPYITKFAGDGAHVMMSVQLSPLTQINACCCCCCCCCCPTSVQPCPCLHSDRTSSNTRKTAAYSVYR